MKNTLNLQHFIKVMDKCLDNIKSIAQLCAHIGSIAIVIAIAYPSRTNAQCESCDRYIDKIYDNVSIQKTGEFKANFESWFFSENFEKEVKDNKVGLSFTLPIEGVPVTFGGNYESPDAWQKYNLNKGSTKWDFSKVTKETIFRQTATDVSRIEWYNCIAACPTNPLPVTVASGDDDGAILTFKYNANIWDNPPKILGFAVTGGITSSGAALDYKNHLMTKGGMAITFTWKDETSTSGTVIMNTSKGSTVPIELHRAPKANDATIVFTVSRLGDYNKPEELEFVHRYSNQQIVLGMSSVKDGGCQIRSPDGKYCSANSHIFVVAQYGDVLKNLKYDSPAVPGSNPNFCKILSTEELPYEVGITVTNWGPNAIWEISYDVYHLKVITTPFMFRSPINGNQFNFDIPKGAGYVSVTVNLLDKSQISFNPMADLLPKQISLLNKFDAGDHWSYSYKLNK